MTKLFDTHCHLDFEPFSADLDDVISRARNKGVDKFLIPACSKSNWRNVAEISQRYSGVYYALGLHPYFTDKHSDSDLDLLEQAIRNRDNKCVAVGECGLDFVKGNDRERQILLLDAQLDLTIQYELPVILHCRGAHQQMIKLLKQKKLPCAGVIHGFSGSYEQAMDYIRLGYYIGVGSTITYLRARKTRNTISKLPLANLVLETDAPDMPLSGYQGEKNVPERVLNVLNELNVLRNEPEQTVADTLYKNSLSVFTICK
ncbi:TatD family hydrolase [Vibrio sp. SCSIO 43137]|uniref:TatD family hydrolase n=1 Tax=Vibrio sp. SCSIO 43137 TaxID=3021011 RepID=UPI0023078C1C|nr:TatD family hydrolase [Vibrio sp. SCSIO 43137]WCE29139.1 TatD family hydrolase [Vibrio sp. SCSIO 43137]